MVEEATSCNGFALTELLVALAIASILSVGIGGLFVSTNRVSESQRAFYDVLSAVDDILVVQRGLQPFASAISGQVDLNGKIVLFDAGGADDPMVYEIEMFLQPGQIFGASDDENYLSIRFQGVEQRVFIPDEVQPALEVFIVEDQPAWVSPNKLPGQQKIISVRLLAVLSGTSFPVVIWSALDT
jgi:prepilin-type N-terminal cleavage/methylation domain-containing protein